MNTHKEVMAELISYATEKMEKGKAYPFASFIVKNGVIISRSVNERAIQFGDKTTHGEMEAMKKATASLKSSLYYPPFLKDYTLYTTCEPCLACFDSALWNGIKTFVYSVDHTDFPEYFNDHKYTLDDYMRDNPNSIELAKKINHSDGVKLFKRAKEIYGW